MDQNLAFEIGAVFFLVVLFTAGTKVGGVFPKLGRNIKYVLMIGVVLVIGYGALSYWPEASAELRSMFGDSPAPVASPSKPSEPVPARAAMPKRANPPAGKVTEIEYVVQAPPEQPEIKPAPVVAEPEPANEHHEKHVMKSIGRVFGFGRKKKSTDDPQ